MGQKDGLNLSLTIYLVLSSGRSQFITRVGNLRRVSVLCINVNWVIHFVTFIRSTRTCYCGYCFCCSDAKSCPTPCNPMDCSIPGFPAFTISLSLLKLMSIESVMPFNHLIFCFPLLLLPSIFPGIRVFSNESALFIKVAKVLELQLQHQSFQFRVDFL